MANKLTDEHLARMRKLWVGMQELAPCWLFEDTIALVDAYEAQKAELDAIKSRLDWAEPRKEREACRRQSTPTA